MTPRGLSLPSARTGIGLRAPHIAEIVATRPNIAWLEIHPENHLSAVPRAALGTLRRDYPIAFHAVGLSLGSAEGVDREHLARIGDLVRELEPAAVSEHLSFSTVDGVYGNDLLPLPYTEEALAVAARNVDAVQEALGRTILVENPSRYLRYRHATMTEGEFLAALARRTGCGILCDVNNIFVSCQNFGEDPSVALAGIEAAAVGEVHVAGHEADATVGPSILIDTHAAPVADPVWSLYAEAVRRFGAVPTLVEWDARIPPLGRLLEEAAQADRIREVVLREARHGRAA
jgi:uncharacterized protein (UPF0276 family)